MMDRNRIIAAVTEILLALDQDVYREGLVDTPGRVADAFIEQCTPEDPELFRQFNEEKFGDIIMVRDINFVSFCEHHMLPFWGKAHIAYVPKDRILGISKLARIVSSYARGFQIQERMTRDIADELDVEIDPLGVIVMIEAKHACISFRGARSIDSSTVTLAVRGMLENPVMRQECISLMAYNR